MKQLTLRGIILGLVGLFVITFSSMYVALRMGALPWPTVFVTVLSMAVLGKAKNSTLQEINVTHTLMSAGSMVAGGLAFTMPGIWMLNPDAQVPFVLMILVTVLGATLGTLFSALFRRSLLEEQQLVFPIGKAAYDTLITGLKKGKQSVVLFASMAFSVIFTLFRDAFGLIPAVLSIFAGNGKVPPVTMWVSPMALAIGAVVDKFSVLCWVIGGLISYFVLSPLGATEVFRQNLGIGIMIGTGVGVLFKVLYAIVFSGKHTLKIKNRDISVIFSVTLVAAIMLSVFTDLSLIQAISAVFLLGVTCLLSGMLTGMSGINPMEIFGILVMLAISAFRKTDLVSMFFVASITAVACGLSGDVMNDLKSGMLLGSDPKQQIFAELTGGIAGAVLSVIALVVMKQSFGAFGTDVLPAPQAKAVASIAADFGNSIEFFVGILIGTVLFLLKFPAATFGLGIYLSLQITIPVGLGALIATVCKRKRVSESDTELVASGFLGGEGIAGVIIAIFSAF